MQRRQFNLRVPAAELGVGHQRPLPARFGGLMPVPAGLGDLGQRLAVGAGFLGECTIFCCLPAGLVPLSGGRGGVGTGTITVNAALLELGGKLTWGRPKSRAGERVVALDAATVAVGRTHRAQRKRERMAAGERWLESGLMFCREDGAPPRPENVSRRFKALAREAGLPVIKLHSARHTAASLMLEAGLDVKIVQDTLGHSTSVITRDTYQHVRTQVHKDAAEKVVALLPEPAARTDAQS